MITLRKNLLLLLLLSELPSFVSDTNYAKKFYFSANDVKWREIL